MKESDFKMVDIPSVLLRNHPHATLLRAVLESYENGKAVSVSPTQFVTARSCMYTRLMKLGFKLHTYKRGEECLIWCEKIEQKEERR